MTLREKIEIGHAFIKWLDARHVIAKNPGKIPPKQQYAYENTSTKLRRTFRRFGFSKDIVTDISRRLDHDVNQH